MQSWIELGHRLIGYPTAFLVAPAALLAFTVPRIHRRWGRLYVYLMTALYASGLFMTLTRHEWGTWAFARNVAFNLLGYSMVVHAYRAIWLFRHPEIPGPGRLDRALAGFQAAVVASVLALAIVRDTPMRVYAAIGLALCVLDWRELGARLQPVPVRFRRHVRYVLASYYYLLTVISIVHLDRAVPRNVKWLWPTVIGTLAAALAADALGPVGPSGRARGLRWAVALTVGVAALLGAYVAVQLVRGAAVAPQAILSPDAPALAALPGHA